MSENQRPNHDPLEEAIEAFQQMTVPDRPPDAELLAQLAIPEGAALRPVSIHFPSKRRYLMRLMVPTAAAAALLLAGLTLFLFNSTSAIALADVVEAAEKHKLVKYKETQTTEDKEQSMTGSTDSVLYSDLKAPRFRRETKAIGDVIESVIVNIQDDRKGRNLMITTETLVPGADPVKTKLLSEGKIFPVKKALLWRSENDSDPKKKPRTMLEHLRELEKHKDAIVSKDKLGGRETVKYYIEDGKKTTKLWVDGKTKLPVQFEHEILDAAPNITLNKWVSTDFEWDPKLKGFKNLDELFDTNPPAGYELEDKTKDTDKK